MMQKVCGPECPTCGCRDSVVTRQVNRFFGKPTVRRACRHCGRQFTCPEDQNGNGHAVTYHRTRCPSCQSANVMVRRTVFPVRYMACRECGFLFKAVEQV